MQSIFFLRFSHTVNAVEGISILDVSVKQRSDQVELGSSTHNISDP
jgi:hypothetical protein